MSKTTPQCDKCGQHLVTVSDAPFGFGRLTFVHGKPCVRPDHPPVIGYCYNEECEKPVYGTKARRRRNTFCSERCRTIVEDLRRVQVLAAGKRYQAKLRKLAKNAA